MTKKEIKELANKAVELLQKMPDGTEISSGQLLFRFMDEAGQMDFSDLLGFDYELRRAARIKHIILDSSKYDDMEVGLPFNLEFVVYHK